MTEARHRRSRSPDEAADVRSRTAARRSIAAEKGWHTSSPAYQALRNHLVTVMAATR